MATNKAMRLGSAMLVLALITTCAIATTFAKYTTSATGNDTARVAYWGWTNTSGYLSSSADLNLFATSYAKDDTSATSGNTVSSSNSQNVVAPGTEGKVDVTFAYTAYAANTKDASDGVSAPEVAYNFTVETVAKGIDDTSAVDVASKLDADPNFFWTLDKTVDGGTKSAVGEYQTLKDLMSAIAALSGGTATDTYSTDGKVTATQEYAPGTLPSAFVSDGKNVTYTIGWVWYFDENSTTTTTYADDSTRTNTTSASDTDTGDTYLGNGGTYAAAATTSADLSDLKLTITVTATQID